MKVKVYYAHLQTHINEQTRTLAYKSKWPKLALLSSETSSLQNAN
jgi:hypothetical protein